MVDVTIRLDGGEMLVTALGKPDLKLPNTPEHFLAVVDEIERALFGQAYEIHCLIGGQEVPFGELRDYAELVVATRSDIARYEDDGGFVL